MPKHRDQKKQKSLFNYFNKEQPKPATEEVSNDLLNDKAIQTTTVVIKNLSSTENSPTESTFKSIATTNEGEPMELDEKESVAPDLISEKKNTVTIEFTDTEDKGWPAAMAIERENKHTLVESTDSDEDIVHKSPKKKQKRHIIEDIDESNDSDTDDDMPIKQRYQKPVPRRIIKVDEPEENDEEEEIIMRRPRKLKQHSNISADVHTAKDDFEEDLEFLDRTDILDERTRGKQVSQYTEALKKLKDRKNKLAEYDIVEKGPIESYTIVVDSSSEDDEEESEEDMEELDQEDFIVDDDIIDGEKVTSEKAELPPEFSKGRTLSFKRQLEIYILYLIELTLNPVFDISSDSKYTIAKEAVMKRVQSYRDSMVTSDVWLPSFKEAMDSYSNWRITRPHISDDFLFCEACRSNKPATIQIQLSSERDSIIEHFYLGSECCRKGKMYHELKHFSSRMFEKVKSLADKKRRQMSTSDRAKSNLIFNILVESGDIKKLTNQVRRNFNDVVMIYNIRGQRSKVESDSSSSDDETD